MTTRAEPVFAQVHCPNCKVLGRSITICTQDQYGNLYFIGKALLALAIDREAQQIKVPCRVCGWELTMHI